jgi:hypothetical protein
VSTRPEHIRVADLSGGTSSSQIQGILCVIKRTSTVSALTVLFFVLGTQHPSIRASVPKTTPNLVITECAGDGTQAWIPYSGPRQTIAHAADVDLDAAFRADTSATFWFVRDKKEIFSFSVDDIDSGSVWIAVDNDPSLFSTPNRARIAITYSDGGAIGGFHVRVFLIDGAGIADASRSIDAAVADFKSRHYCETRGNNVTALKWIRGDLLLMTEVYPTGDCGRDLGHTEGYLVSIPRGKILEHMTLHQLVHFPGVCFENEEEN